VFQNRVLRRTLGTNEEEVKGSWEKTAKQGTSLYSNIIYFFERRARNLRIQG
jgi:hypothetical protein